MASQIRVDGIQPNDPNYVQVQMPHGLEIGSGYALIASSGLTVTGILTSSSGYSGDGSNLSGITFCSPSKAIAFAFLK